MSWKIHETEKSYSSQVQSTFVLVCDDINQEKSFNKISIAQKLKKAGLKVVKVTTASSYKKTKRRNSGKNTIKVWRPVKWYIKLEPGQKITEDSLSVLNQ